MASETVWAIVFAIYSLWLFWCGFSYGRIFESLSRIEQILKCRASENSTDAQTIGQNNRSTEE